MNAYFGHGRIVPSLDVATSSDLTLSLPKEGRFVARPSKDGTNAALLGLGRAASGGSIAFDEDGSITAVLFSTLDPVALDATHTVDKSGVLLVGIKTP